MDVPLSCEFSGGVIIQLFFVNEFSPQNWSWIFHSLCFVGQPLSFQLKDWVWFNWGWVLVSQKKNCRSFCCKKMVLRPWRGTMHRVSSMEAFRVNHPKHSLAHLIRWSPYSRTFAPLSGSWDFTCWRQPFLTKGHVLFSPSQKGSRLFFCLQNHLVFRKPVFFAYKISWFWKPWREQFPSISSWIQGVSAPGETFS